ncbi:hydroxymethylglutaryl-CoA reductase [Lacticaseibacillus manihotivorans DSM 13343 = JCM 12514]|uniref:3-hydroxy-3-methylglutaryl coenzyme A reductase n=1 Tax=Lacticaseibacillus manihotivorans DSM 13343 = JCM 12514 TaxID=1423769 RepID=A0A0R1QH09_9LACO|nr:hydroxymethylglutaryl-CoA reductase, degradative [Lacticaseibacillus manihotivorans]KRL43841.1 hydroxymethylglutaryl-CoA reductase [Lacticaseibacillus manihotivorans DSM 13343 = JCM 12514]
MVKFYQMTPAQRRAALVQSENLTPADADFWADPQVLPAAIADALSENQIGQFALPLGVAKDLMVNGRVYQVPMATEEPSVIAAASNGARIAKFNGGVTTTAAKHVVVGEIVFDQLADLPGAQQMINARRAEIRSLADAAHPSIVRRGGGLQKVETQILAHFLKISLIIDVQQAMGANIVNTICEAVAGQLKQWLNADALVAILSNEDRQLTTASVALSVETLQTKTTDGPTIARKIAALSDLAQVDVARAVTHNKGIMNGISAAVLASGNDTRAVSAAVHAYAAASGHYVGLSTWHLEADQLIGQLSLPLPVGIVGGAISALPAAQAAKRLGNYQDVATLQQVLVALGLVQNLAALRALAGPGIQAGHMALQANALAIQAGASGDEIQQVAQALQTQTKNLATAKDILGRIRDEKGEQK